MCMILAQARAGPACRGPRAGRRAACDGRPTRPRRAYNSRRAASRPAERPVLHLQQPASDQPAPPPAAPAPAAAAAAPPAPAAAVGPASSPAAMVVATAPLGIRDAAVALPEATSQQPVTDSAPTARGGIQPRGGALRVLAIGDSLTQGSVPSKHLNHPYTLKLRPVLEGLVGQPVVAQDAGLGGGGIFMASEMKGYETVTFGPWLDTHLAQGPWSVVVVCVGINDLLRGGRAAADIAEGLAPMLDRVLATDTPVLLIPPFPAPGSVPNESDSKEEQRKLLPGLYRELAAKRAAATGGRGAQIWLLDLQSGPPFNFYAYAKSEAERAKWLDDGLHLTEFGYETLGEAVARELATHVAPAAAS